MDLPGLEFSLFSHSIILISPTVIFAALANTCDKNLQELGLQKKEFGDHAEINREFKNYVYGK